MMVLALVISMPLRLSRCSCMGTEELAFPAAGEVQIAVRCIGLNFADVFSCLGLYSATPRGEFIPGKRSQPLCWCMT